MKQIIVGNSTMNLIDQGAGPVILLVHGFPLDHSMWKYQIEPLTDFSRVICPDLPGFGASVGPGQPDSMRRFADDLAAMLDALEVESVTFCGLSMGGYIGWQFWKYHAHRVERLIACDTRAAADSETVARGRRISAEAVLANGSSSIAHEMTEKLFAPASLQHRGADVEMIRNVISATNPETVAKSQLAMAKRPDADSWLPEIQIPTLFVVGQHDQITTPDEMRANSDQVANAQFVSLTDAGHLSPLENPEDFNRVVKEFVL